MAANVEMMMYVSARPRRQHAPPEHEKLRGKQLEIGEERPCPDGQNGRSLHEVKR